jgi:hypothetical protein
MSRNKANTDEEIIGRRLRHFINKYYRIRIFQGLALTLFALLAVLLVLVIAGNLAGDNQSVRLAGQILGGLLVAAVVAVYVLRPMAQQWGWIKGLNLKEASRIIQEKHKPVEDRIINIIELAKEKKGKENQLYDFAISQKAERISGYDFDEAISFRKLGKFLLRLAALGLVGGLLVVAWPDFVKKGVARMLKANGSESYLNEVNFIIRNDSLVVEAGKDFLLKFGVESGLPAENVAVVVGSLPEKVAPTGQDYLYTFKAVNSSVSFRLSCNGITSGEYVLKTLKRPEIAGLTLKLVPPSYTGQESRLIEGDGNVEVPAGSRVIWTIRSVNTDRLLYHDEKDSVTLLERNGNFNYEKTVHDNLPYILAAESNNGLSTYYNYKISVVKDLYPNIDISEKRDSAVTQDVYVQGVIQDDYGFSKLEAIVEKSGRQKSTEINIKNDNLYQDFYYTIVPDSINSIYFFRVWDNDRIGGPKYTDSRKISVRTISRQEIENLNTQLADSIRNNMSEGMDAVDKLEKKISDFRMEQILGELKPWEIQERLKELNQLKQDVVDFINNINETNKEFNENEQYLTNNEQLKEKAKQIQDLMQNLLDDELKDLLKQLEELAKEYNAQKGEEMTKDMDMSLDRLKEQMDMSLELFRKYEMEKDLLKLADQVDKMADSLDNLNEGGKEGLKEQVDREKANEEGKGGKDSSGLFKNRFEKWEQEYDKNLEKNSEFKEPMKLRDMEQERKEVRDAGEKMDNNQDAGQEDADRKETSKKLRKLSQTMNNMLNTAGGGGEMIDLEDLRQIRNALNDFSMKQEELNGRINRINTISPTFSEVMKAQKELENKFISIKDSLKSMGYKQPIVAKILGDEMFHVETSFGNLFENYSSGRANIVRIEQNKIMDGVNSMAVKIDELVSQMENAKGGGSGGQGFKDRKHPKQGDESGSEKLGETRSMQESLKDQLKSAIERMKAGMNGKEGREELAKMLGKREMMRKALQKLVQDGGLGMDARQKANQALNMMKEVEKDIIYNKLTDQTLQKDNFIHTRLLEAENSERERENENRRESKEFKGKFEPYLKELDSVGGTNKTGEQLLKYKELKLKKFYQDKYERYLESTRKK